MIESYTHHYNIRRVQRNLGVLTPMEQHQNDLPAAQQNLIKYSEKLATPPTEALTSDSPEQYPVPDNMRIQKCRARFTA